MLKRIYSRVHDNLPESTLQDQVLGEKWPPYHSIKSLKIPQNGRQTPPKFMTFLNSTFYMTYWFVRIFSMHFEGPNRLIYKG